MTQAQDAFATAASLGLKDNNKKVLNEVLRGVKEDIDTNASGISSINSDLDDYAAAFSVSGANVTFSGTVTADSFIPTSSTVPTNGVYLPATNSVALATNGTGRLFVDSSGNVGVGTSSPSQLLHVNGSTNGGIRVEGTGFSTGANIQILNTSNSNTTPSFIGQRTTATPTRGIEIGDGTNPYFYVDTSNGRVGIGSTSPTNTLHVRSDSNSNVDHLYLQNRDTGANTGARIAFSNGGVDYSDNRYAYIGAIKDGATGNHLVFAPNASGNAATESARIDSSGRLLIGTSSARSNFINSSVSPALQLESTSKGGNILSLIRNQSSGTTGIGGELYLARSGGTSLGSNTIVADDNLLGQVTFSGADGSEFVTAAVISSEVDGTPGANDMPGRLVFSVTADGASSPTEAMRIKNSGIINIANTPTYADNAAAKTGGLVDGDVYRTSTGDLKIVYT